MSLQTINNRDKSEKADRGRGQVLKEVRNLKGGPLIEPDKEILYNVSDRVLHEAEGIRYRREIKNEAEKLI